MLLDNKQCLLLGFTNTIQVLCCAICLPFALNELTIVMLNI